MRMIDADVFDSMLKDAQVECKKNGGNFRYGVLSTVRANLAKMPTIDAVPVVQCKDCKYVECEGMEGYLVCDISGFSHHPDYYCADGERQ